jgi:hypothetical protein
MKGIDDSVRPRAAGEQKRQLSPIGAVRAWRTVMKTDSQLQKDVVNELE